MHLNNGKKQAERCSASGSNSRRVHFVRLLTLTLHKVFKFRTENLKSESNLEWKM
jgi:hypothetical protein